MIAPRFIAPIACVALLAGCATPPLTPSEEAVAAAPPSREDGVHRFRIGRLEAAVVNDGYLGGPVSAIWKDPSPAEIGGVLAAAGLPTDAVELDLDVLMVRTGSRVFLFDSGNGTSSPTAGRLIPNLAKLGVSPAQVTDIVISHSHGDHVGGLVDASGASAFSNAAIHMGAAEWAAVQTRPGGPGKLAAVAAQVRPFQPGAVLAPGITAVEVRGHTPGHSAVEIASDGQRLLAVGDSAHHSVVSLQLPEATISFDGDAPTAETSRRALLQRATDERLRLFAPHFPYPGLGTVRREGEGFVWQPAP
jgi:glyoxylase-like metal-dependent hydrolase (beta-lactamase superfamily II)